MGCWTRKLPSCKNLSRRSRWRKRCGKCWRLFQKGITSMTDKFRAIARRCYLDMGMPRVGREVVGLYPTRKEAENACTEFVKSQGDSFRAAYDDCIIEVVPEADKGNLDGCP